MSILHNLTLSKALNLLEKGEITAVNLTEHYLKKIQNSEKLNAFCLKSSDLAISKAEYCDKIMKSEKRGKLCGIPIAIKDIFCTKTKEHKLPPKYYKILSQNMKVQLQQSYGMRMQLC